MGDLIGRTGRCETAAEISMGPMRSNTATVDASMHAIPAVVDCSPFAEVEK